MSPEPTLVPTPPQEGGYKKPENAQMYMRTYAKDIAQLKGKPLTQTSPVNTPVERPVEFEEIDTSSVQKTSGSSPQPKEFAPQTVVLSKDDDVGLFETKNPPTLGTSREEILARLRAKIGQPGNADTPKLQSPLAKKPPSESSFFFNQKKEPLPAVTRPPEPLSGLVVTSIKTPSPIHTYSSDFSDRIDQKKANTFSVLAAEQDATKVKSLQTAPRKSLLPFVFGVLFLVVGVAGVYGAATLVQKAAPGSPSTSVPSIIFADEVLELKGETGAELMQALANATQQQVISGNVLVTYITESSTTPLGVSTVQPGGALIKKLSLQAPDILFRNISPLSTVGVVNSGTRTVPFFIFRVTSYERTFAGMLAWEPLMQEALSTLYPSSGTTGETSSQFIDAVVANHDVRILIDQHGEHRIIYGYTDKQTLILTRDEASFTALAKRLSTTKEK
jgi:hypothetical protein